ncbi:MAG: hypothetical protein KJZ80_09765 [Hyphomicrobiaceae bacterium]|nr:hypothetical protein [Hyphomicrobiaceae bacterium]
MSKKLIMSLVAGLMAVAALQAPAAEAKGKGKGLKIHIYKHHVLKWHNWHAPLYVVGADDCGYYYWKWKHTGSFLWKSKYFACKGIY